jgi:hypothetical protein
MGQVCLDLTSWWCSQGLLAWPTWGNTLQQAFVLFLRAFETHFTDRVGVDLLRIQQNSGTYPAQNSGTSPALELHP